MERTVSLKHLVDKGGRGTQKRLASHLGTSHVVVSMFTNGKRRPSPENAERIADFFGATAQFKTGEWRFRPAKRAKK